MDTKNPQELAEFLEKQAATIRERLERYHTMARNPEVASDDFRNAYLENKFTFSIPNGEHALAKIARGEYNVCDECEGEIGYARLEAVPAALCCISCQEKLEKNKP
jgi:RNA polymerase-binding transcription factor DksA